MLIDLVIVLNRDFNVLFAVFKQVFYCLPGQVQAWSTRKEHLIAKEPDKGKL